MVDPIRKYNPYHKESIRIAEESKTILMVEPSIIINTLDDLELGKRIRKMYNDKCEIADKHIEYIKGLMES
jgi:hypothetical protein